MIAGNSALREQFSSDVLFIQASMRQSVDDAAKDEIEGIQTIKGAKKKLTVLVEINSRSVEAVERIVSVSRKHYDNLEYVVHDYASSAGVILVRSADEVLIR
ncbi:hypothetical protein DNX69_07375 [Rhodopseudomonas palustris]|uniref:Uncharacterized protein n=1 Tax=Rhodopseudomonas palustris TaxID=1076 RepID=A0A323UJZ2_RHOPL|nr:hypothetical protein [Rhodopseudomonas palustris]PZA12709.1 hypothetical protein DNX69_07375 [Rhodopseudomonas palustris]